MTRLQFQGVEIIQGDNLEVIQEMPSESQDLIYIDPPFNTGKVQSRTALQTTQDSKGDRVGFQGLTYKTTKLSEMSYADSFGGEYLKFIAPRLEEAYRLLKPNGSLFVHLDYREVHYVKVVLDTIFGRDSFLNEIIWAYDYGARSRKRWATKHDTILCYVKDPNKYTFNYDAIDRIPYMAPSLVGAEKAERGKTPTDCYSEDTDIWTQRGWVPFPELQPTDAVATVSACGALTFVVPSTLHKILYQGDLIQISTRTVNLRVTPNHNLYVRRRHGKGFEFVMAEQVLPEQVAPSDYFFLMNKLKWGGEQRSTYELPPIQYKNPGASRPLPPFDMGDWCEFMGWYLSEGSTTYYRDRTEVTIAQLKKKNRPQITALLTRMGFTFQTSKTRFVVCNKQLADYLSQFGKAPQKRIPRELLELAIPHLERLYEGLMGGDGNRNGNCWTYFTVSRGLAEDVQELILKLGFNSNISFQRPQVTVRSSGKVFRGNHKKWCVSRRVAKESSFKPSSHVSQVPYHGFVYCCTVEPNHTLVVRRADKPVVCGNCWWNTIVPTNGKEKTGYPTQKPLSILERIVVVHSNEGDQCLDFFAGSGSFGIACVKHNRQVTLVDDNPEAISVMKQRFETWEQKQ